MSVELLSDHDTFKKVRRALFSTSISVFIISNMEIITDRMIFFGLELGVDNKKIIGFGLAAIFYFVFLFSFKSRELLYEMRFKNRTIVYEESVENVTEKLRTYFRDLIKESAENSLLDYPIKSDVSAGSMPRPNPAREIVTGTYTLDDEERAGYGEARELLQEKLTNAVVQIFEQKARNVQNQVILTEIIPPCIAAVAAVGMGFWVIF